MEQNPGPNSPAPTLSQAEILFLNLGREAQLTMPKPKTCINITSVRCFPPAISNITSNVTLFLTRATNGFQHFHFKCFLLLGLDRSRAEWAITTHPHAPADFQNSTVGIELIIRRYQHHHCHFYQTVARCPEIFLYLVCLYFSNSCTIISVIYRLPVLSKRCASIISFNLCNNFWRLVLWVPSFNTKENQSPERSRNLPQITQLVSSRV